MNTIDTQVSKANILIVDDNSNNLDLLSRMLLKRKLNVSCAIDGISALEIAQSGWSDIILLDIQMPEMNGYEVCRQIKANDKTKNIPVIFLSALDDIFDKKQAFSVGGVDFISKPFQVGEVLVRIENQLAIIAAKKEVEQLNSELELRVRDRTAELEKANQNLQKSLLEKQIIQDKLLHTATHDRLTGLFNRFLFLQRLNRILENIKHNPQNLFAVFLIDCDRFKWINDSLGPAIGDRVLIEVAERFKDCLDPSKTLARFGGDEFAILVPEIQDIQQAIDLAQQLQDKLKLKFQIEQHQLFLSASIGIVFGSPNYPQAEYILRDADTAMYIAKARGKARYEIFDPAMHDKLTNRLSLATDLRLALRNRELAVYYQPLICFKTNRISGFEALVRWQHPQKGFISPGKFIPIAEETGLIIPLGFWVMQQACQQLAFWQQQYGLNKLKISVNLSVLQFAQPDLIDRIDRIIAETKINSRNLKLEITESAIMDNAESATALLRQLKERHIQLSIDDFGTGYSSLSYLHRFPVDTLKIDRSFVSRIGENGENLEIIEAIVDLAHHFKMNVVAEGIETQQQENFLKAINCEEGQGYFYAKPMSACDIKPSVFNLEGK